MASLIRYFFAPSLEGGHFARKAAAFFDDARRHLDSSARRRHSSAQLINFSAYRGDDLLFLSTPSSRPPKHRLDMAPKPKMGNTSVVHVICRADEPGGGSNARVQRQPSSSAPSMQSLQTTLRQQRPTQRLAAPPWGGSLRPLEDCALSWRLGWAFARFAH